MQVGLLCCLPPTTTNSRQETFTEVPLVNVEIKAKIIDLTAEVHVSQIFINSTSNAVEAKYVFPLDERCAVNSFRASYNGRNIIGRVEEKKQAKDKYEKAKSQGKVVMLLEQEKPDIFEMQVGCIPPFTAVKIEFTYVTELLNELDQVRFYIPTHVAPRIHSVK